MPLHPDCLRFEHPFTVHVWATDEARDCQLLCYEPCTCRYTQTASASNIPSPCMSGRPDEARDCQLLCYEPCTCRYTQTASASSIPSPCMSARRRHGIPSFCVMSHAHAVTPRLPQLRASLHRACPLSNFKARGARCSQPLLQFGGFFHPTLLSELLHLPGYSFLIVHSYSSSSSLSYGLYKAAPTK